MGAAYGNTKKFMIDHPLDPKGKHLLHGCIEGPENAVFYRGEARLVDGMARVELPEYFEALTRGEGRTVFLTPKLEGGDAATSLAASAVRGGAFTVRSAPGDHGEHAFYWEVKAVRADVEKLVVEIAKDSDDIPHDIRRVNL
jgi:hypothetical protein